MEALGAYLGERDINETLKEQLVQRAEGIINESSFIEKELF